MERGATGVRGGLQAPADRGRRAQADLSRQHGLALSVGTARAAHARAPRSRAQVLPGRGGQAQSRRAPWLGSLGARDRRASRRCRARTCGVRPRSAFDRARRLRRVLGTPSRSMARARSDRSRRQEARRRSAGTARWSASPSARKVPLRLADRAGRRGGGGAARRDAGAGIFRARPARTMARCAGRIGSARRESRSQRAGRRRNARRVVDPHRQARRSRGHRAFRAEARTARLAASPRH